MLTSKQGWRAFPLRRSWLVIVGLAVLAGGFFGWRALFPARPNVLLITLDTTRADRLGCYGYADALTPTLDALAAEGVLFEHAYTPAPLTLPSHASMMTGLYPREHGLITNGRGRLVDQLPTLAEKLRDGGYETAAFVASFVLHSKFGLQQGFATYDDDLTGTAPAEHGLYRQRDGRQVVDSALSWLQQRRAKPFFCWVHLYDPHLPYEAHADEFGDRYRAQPYDGELAYVDLQVQRLVAHLQANRLWEQTLVVVAGDHGESLGEHDEDEHGLTLYNSVLQIPWIWTGWGVTARGQRVSQPVSLVDLRPTLLEVAGLRESERTSGRSLRAALSGDHVPTAVCYSATDEPFLAHAWSPLRCLTSERWKYIRSPEPELYDLTTDPRETKNLAAERTDEVRQFDNELLALEKSMTVRTAANVELSLKELEALRTFGYVGGLNRSPQQLQTTKGESLPDVKRMLPLYKRADAAYRLMYEGDAPAAEERIRELIREAPDYGQLQLYLAEVLTNQRKYSESREVLEGVLRKEPDNADAHFQLGTVHWSQQQYAEAADEYRRSLVSEPDAVRGLFSLAQALVPLGQIEEAEKLFRRAVKGDPAYVNARAALASLLAGQRRVAEAEQEFREALKYSSRSVVAHTNLAILLAQQRRLAEAGEHFAKAVELSPENAELQFNYGTFLLLQGRQEEAVRALEEALRLNPEHSQARQRLQQARRQ